MLLAITGLRPGVLDAAVAPEEFLRPYRVRIMTMELVRVLLSTPKQTRFCSAIERTYRVQRSLLHESRATDVGS